MGQLITNLAPTTETEAVNAMLSAIGESPVADASTATQADVQMAYNLLKWATRELQSVAWRFNTEDGVQLLPTDQTNWQDSTGATTLLNIFKLPPGVTQWHQTLCPQNHDLDLVIRPSKLYQQDSAPVLVLYDRAKNRDGVDAGLYPFLYIDAIYTFNFEQMPETARRFATVVAGRRFTEQVVGSTTLAGFEQRDEAAAGRNLIRDQGLQEDLNMLDTVEAHRTMGGRPRVYEGFQQTVAPGGITVLPVMSDGETPVP